VIVSGKLEQRRTFLSQRLQIDNFIVGSASLPALPDNPNPFESQSADGGVMVFAFGALARVVSAGPEGVLDRLSSELMKGLAKELGTEVAPTDAELFAAALDDRSDAVGPERGERVSQLVLRSLVLQLLELLPLLRLRMEYKFHCLPFNPLQGNSLTRPAR
jgi:hypothetical protein